MPTRPRPFEAPIYVTRPMLPPRATFDRHLDSIWDSGRLTNGGDEHQALERALSEHLRAPHLSLFNNGTIALIAACQALRITGEVITTPFTFPATPHVLSWNGITPVFCDVDPRTLTIDPAKVERLVTARTTAILGVHVYGMPCHVDEIQRIADEYGLRVLYDGAHAFGTEVDGRPISDFGDATMFSFHATKLFHTAEGGALAVRDPGLKARIDLLKNFGIKNEVEVVMPGINGKMNELQAALGLANLEVIAAEMEARRAVAEVYRARLLRHDGITTFDLPVGTKDSRQYLVVQVDAARAGISRDRLCERMREFNVFARRYFYPLCSDFNCYRSLPSADPRCLPVAQKASTEVLALPYFGLLGVDGASRVCDVIDHLVDA